MGKFKNFYVKLQEEKLLKLKEKENFRDISNPKDSTPKLNDLLKKEDEEFTTDILKADQKSKDNDGFFQDKKEIDDKFPVAKPVFNGIQRRNDLSTDSEESVDETINYSTKIPKAYPTGPINLGNSRLIRNPQSNGDVEGTYGFDVTISNKNNLFSFIGEQPITFQLNENGVMRFENVWTEDGIRAEINQMVKKSKGKTDKEDQQKLFRIFEYLRAQNKSDYEAMKKFSENFNDYILYWKFEEKLNAMKPEDFNTDEEFQSQKETVQRRMDELKNKPDEGDLDGYVKSQEFYNTLVKMGDITVYDLKRAVELVDKLNIPRITYFYPTLMDVIRMYDEGQTSVTDIPTDIAVAIDGHDETNPLTTVKESLYRDVMMSSHYERDGRGNAKSWQKMSYQDANPRNTEIFAKDFGGNLGDVVYEFVSKGQGNWNRITDKGVVIGYGRAESFTSVDIRTCYCLAYCDLPNMLKDSPNYNQKLKSPEQISIKMLKTCLQNLVSGRCAADHDFAMNRNKSDSRRFIG